ncbi:hypothetical protein [Algoriphagus sp. A40]|uniref:hypothetical protein n=1 Tax=Algoriphagus sp. A40 TaxID=1945863 RepID=UPI0009855A48|nr:hypothetical protein [Algoriphagus sp. A40]OOG77896.1 hypothetical protein B0E43_03800 [Algoriphagus sp. A40]
MLKKTISLWILILALTSGNFAFSQIKAVTEKGDTIYVYNDGTWSYELQEIAERPELLGFLSEEIPITKITEPVNTPSTSLQKVRNENDQFSFYYNETEWKRVPPASLNDEAEFAFESKLNDSWAIIISEETPIEKENLFKIAKYTMSEKMGSEVEVVKAESILVNGQEVIRGVLKTTASGFTFIFDSFYFSDDRGSVQISTWTSEAIWKKNEKNHLDLLSGFVVQ